MFSLLATESTEQRPKEPDMAEVVWNVPDISCGHCVGAIEKALADVAEVESVSASADTKTVTLTASDAGLAAAKDALTAIGFPVAS